MGQTSVDASLDRPHVLFCKEVENLVKVLLLCHGGKSPEAEAHVAQQRGPKPPPGETRGASHMYHRCPAQNIERETNIVRLPVAILGNLYRRACDMLRSVAWKFSKTLLAARSAPQNATDIGRNVPWASQPTVPGELGRNFQPERSGTLVACLVPTLPARCHGEQYVKANVCLPFVCFAYKIAWRTLCSSL